MVGASLALSHPMPSVDYASDADLLAACRRQDLRAFEQLYETHGAQAEIDGVSHRRQPAGRGGRRAGDLRQGLPRDSRLSGTVGNRHLALPDPDQRLLRRHPQAAAGGRPGGARARNPRRARAGISRSRSR